MKTLITIFTLMPSFIFAQVPINDVPCGAINIPVFSAANCVPTTIYQWANATFGANGTPNATCGNFNNTSKDVWYKFTALNNNCAILFDKAYTISHDLSAAVYDAESCTLFYSNQWCNDDDGPTSYPQLQIDDLIAGATYYLRVWQYNATIDSGSAKICIVSEPTIPPTTGKTGVNTNFPSTSLDVNGTIKIRGGTPGLNKVLTSDAVGLASWQTSVPSGSAAFSVSLDSNRTIINGAGDKRLHFGNYGSSVGNFINGTSFNSTTDEFVAQTSGLYSFTMDIYLVPFPSNDYNIQNQFRVDNSSNTAITQVAFIDFVAAGTLNSSHSHTAQFNLNVGDKVYILSKKFNSSSTANITVSYGFGSITSTRFMGYKIN